jgi:hypothetical protein
MPQKALGTRRRRLRRQLAAAAALPAVVASAQGEATLRSPRVGSAGSGQPADQPQRSRGRLDSGRRQLDRQRRRRPASGSQQGREDS